MNHRFTKTFFIALISTLALAGCERPELQQELKDQLERFKDRGINGQFTLPLNANYGAGGDWSFRLRTGPAFTKPPVLQIDIRDIQIRLQGDGANIGVANGLATLSLESGDSVVGTGVFAYSKVGDDIVFDQPQQVNDWINSFTVDINGFDLTLNSIAIAVPESMMGRISSSQTVLGRQIGSQSFAVHNSGGNGGFNVTPEAP